MAKKHAKLSASGSHRWMKCPGSVNASKDYPNTSSVYADEGTIAHELADRCFKARVPALNFVDVPIKFLNIKVDSFDPNTKISKEMAKHVDSYMDYIISFETENSNLFTEQRVDFSKWVPEGFGTCDAALYIPESKTLHVFDLKYGKGVIVEAEENSQALLYSLGFYDHISFIEDIENISIHICQPRANNFSRWDITLKDLMDFSQKVSEAAKLALTSNAPRIPGEKQCLFCQAKNDCKTLYDYTSELISSRFSSSELSNYDLKILLDNKKLIIGFLNSIEKRAFKMIMGGDTLEGYKIVEGRSNRKWAESAESVLVEYLGPEAYSKKLIPLSYAKDKLPDEIMENITIKPPGKPTLVKSSDKRKSFDFDMTSIQFDTFDDEDDEESEED